MTDSSVVVRKRDRSTIGAWPADGRWHLCVWSPEAGRVELVLADYNKHRAKGWGAIARDLGIKPGSKEFHALKEGDFTPGRKGEKEKGHGKRK